MRAGITVTTPLFSSKNYEGVRVTSPTQCDSKFIPLDRPHQRRPRTLFFSGAPVGRARFIAERDLASQDRAGAKENTRSFPKLFLLPKKERQSERERERELHDGREYGSHASFAWPRFITERTTCLQSSTELKQKSWKT